jgi:CheY-like chemotaxis protein
VVPGLQKNLLSFSRRADLKPIRLNLNQVVQDTLDWGNRILPEIIKVNCSLATGLEDVDLDLTSVENALLNILLNARDAMPGGGEVTIRTTSIEIPEDDAPTQFEGIQPGHYVQLSICDTGHGISSDKIEKIFEPFYTDKPVGQGSGLGLSMVHGFIKQSGGAIRVHSEVGVGTTFDLYFMAVEGELASSKSEQNIQTAVPKVAAKILLVEDDVDVMRVMEQHLNDAGYSVVTAENGDEALGIFKACEEFDLLLTDVMMPGKIQGPALAEELQMIEPKLPCILLSGYAVNALVPESERVYSYVRLSKPVLRKDLLKAVAQALQS